MTFRTFRNIQRATRIFVCVTALSKSHEFLLKVHWVSYFFSTTTPTPSHQRVIFFPRRRKGFDFDEESMVFQRRRTLWRADLWRRRDIDFSPICAKDGHVEYFDSFGRRPSTDFLLKVHVNFLLSTCTIV